MQKNKTILCQMNSYPPSKLDRPEILAAIFHPRSEERYDTPPSCSEFEVTVPGEDVILGCRFFSADHLPPSIIYFHGNGETVADYDQIAPFYLQAGLNILIVSYRGYGWSSGIPTVSALFHDSGMVLQSFIRYCEDNGVEKDIFVMGRSLGSAFCIDIAYNHAEMIKGIIIDSGFANTLPLAARLGYDVGASGLSEEDCFNNLEKIKHIKLPTLLLHGAEDQLIPLQEAVKLQAESAARNKQLFIVPGADHNSLILRGGSSYFETIKSFTDTVLGKPVWREKRRKYQKRDGGN